MKFLILFFTFCFWTTHGFPEIPTQNSESKESADISVRNGLLVEDIGNGTTYRFTSLQDESVITVLSNGDVISDVWNDLPTQKWTIVEHFRDRQFVEFKQKAVPYNMLSGFEPIPDQPDIYPRPLILTKFRIMPTLSLKDDKLYQTELPPIPWQILIRSRYCMQSNGYGRNLDYGDCEYQPAPWQFWKLEVVEP